MTARLVRISLFATIAAGFVLCAPANAFAAFGFLDNWGTLGSGDGQLDFPTGIAAGPNGHVYVGDAGNFRIDEFTSTGGFVRAWGKNVGGAGVNSCTSGCQVGVSGTGNGEFTNTNSDLDVQPASGDVYVLDDDRIKQFTASGAFIRSWGGIGGAEGKFAGGYGGVDAIADAVYVADDGNRRVQQFTLDGAFVRMWGKNVGGAGIDICTVGCSAGQIGTQGGHFNGAADVGVAPSGDIWVVDGTRIQQFTSALGFVRLLGNDVGGVGVNVCTSAPACVAGTSGSGDGEFAAPTAVAFDAPGNVWIGDSSNSRLQEFNASGSFITKYGPSQGSGANQFDNMYGINFDCVGNLYVADTENQRVQKLGEPGAGEPPCGPKTPNPPPATPATPAAGQIQSLSLGSKTFKAVNTGGAIFSKSKSKSKAPIGTTVSYALSAAGTTSFSAERVAKGRKSGKKCKKQTSKNRKRKKCTLIATVKGGFTHVGAAGQNKFKFSGRLNNAALKPGSYRLVAITGSVVKRAEFKIVR